MKLAEPTAAAARTTATKYPTVGNPSEFVAKMSSLVDVEDAALDVVDAVLDAVELEVVEEDEAVLLADVEVLVVDAEAVVEVAVVLVAEAEVSLVDVAEVVDVDDSVAVELVVVVSARARSFLNSTGADLGSWCSLAHHSAAHIASSSASSPVQPAWTRHACRVELPNSEAPKQCAMELAWPHVIVAATSALCSELQETTWALAWGCAEPRLSSVATIAAMAE